MKIVEIKQSQKVLAIDEPEFTQFIFRPGVVINELVQYTPVELIDPVTRDSQRGIGITTPDCIVRNHRSEHHDTPLAWYGKADRLQVHGGLHRFCVQPFYGQANGTRGANNVKIIGLVAEDLIAGKDPGCGVQNGSYSRYEVTIRRAVGDAFVLYQTCEETGGVIMACQYNTVILNVEAVNGRLFDFGGSGSIVDGEKHKGNRVEVTGAHCAGGLRLKARASGNPWRIRGTFRDCPNYEEFFGWHYKADIKSL